MNYWKKLITGKATHRGSSLVYLGFSLIAFIIAYGIGWLLVPDVLGQFYASLPVIPNPSWAATLTHNENVIQWLIPLSASMGIFILVIKVLMTASNRGRD